MLKVKGNDCWVAEDLERRLKGVHWEGVKLDEEHLLR